MYHIDSVVVCFLSMVGAAVTAIWIGEVAAFGLKNGSVIFYNELKKSLF